MIVRKMKTKFVGLTTDANWYIRQFMQQKKQARKQKKMINTIKKVIQSTSPNIQLEASHMDGTNATFRSITAFRGTDQINHINQSNRLATTSQTEPFIDVESEENENIQTANDQHEHPQFNEMIASDGNELSIAPPEMHMAIESTKFDTKLNGFVINRSTTTNHQPNIKIPFHDHTYAQCEQIKKVSKVYRCDKCEYWTTKKSSMTDHQAEFCPKNAAFVKRDLQCPGCPKKFSRLGLRLHLNYYKRNQKRHTKATQLQNSS